LQTQITQTATEIYRIVYQPYSINKEEIDIIEYNLVKGKSMLEIREFRAYGYSLLDRGNKK
tara:strand:+ start:428 stop:610 length:183 start_codon:yes stop_codon:yes gene_type:complete